MACGTSCEIKKYEVRSTASTKVKVVSQKIEVGTFQLDHYMNTYLNSYRIGQYVETCLKETGDNRFSDTVKGEGCGADCMCVELEPAQTTATRWVTYTLQNPFKISIMIIYWNSNNRVDTYEIEISGEYEVRAVTFKGECMPSNGSVVIHETLFPTQLDSIWVEQDIYVVTNAVK